MGIHTALDTNGYYGDKLSDAELESVDLVMLDLKTWDAERHRHLTGMDVAPTHAFARRLADRRRPVWVRYVLVPGLTDDLDDITNTARFAAQLGNVERVDVLPFHQLGMYKWKRLGLPYALETTQPPSADLVERVCGVFRDAGLKAV
jgi:pyruvate formate lyase activating enzyme